MIETNVLLDQNLFHGWVPELNVRFDSRPVSEMVKRFQLQQVSPPGTPRLSVEDCRILNGKISLSWSSSDPLNCDLYVVEVADSGGQFTVSLC